MPHSSITPPVTSRVMRAFKWGVFSALIACFAVNNADAQDSDWWFDIEVVVFKRNLEINTIAEQFTAKPPKFAGNLAFDLLTDYIQPNLEYLNAGLMLCEQTAQTNTTNQLADTPSIDNSVFQMEALYLADEQAPISVHTPVFGEETRPDVYAQPEPANQTGGAVTALQKIDWQLPRQLPCIYAEDRVLLTGPYDRVIPNPMPKRVPVEIDGVYWPNRLSPYLLPKAEGELDDLVKRIAGQKALSPILHLTWRQPVVFGRSKAAPMKLIAGPNYADAFSQTGQRKPTPSIPPPFTTGTHSAQIANALPEDLFVRIERALSDNTPVNPSETTHPGLPKDQEQVQASPLSFAVKAEKPLWQLEGEMKVYLQNVGRTPYLHIDSDLDFRVPITLEQEDTTSGTNQDFLQSYNFNQLRRVISTQLHYFDHPLFGMVVQIRRYQPPQPADNLGK